MRTLYLIRHAQGSLGTANYDQLSALGYQQAEILAEACRTMLDDSTTSLALFRGELQRHRQTAATMSTEATGLDGLNEYRVDRLLQSAFADPQPLGIERPSAKAMQRPADYLSVFMALFPDVLKAWQEDRLICPENGDWRDFRQRVMGAAAVLQQQMAHSDVIAITSAGVISTMAAELLGQDLAWQRSLNVALYNASLTELKLDGQGQWHAGRINCLKHFEDPQLHTLA